VIDSIKNAALRAVDEILQNPEKERNIINTLGIFSETLLSDPKNVKIVLEKISKQAPNQDESPLITLRRKALAYKEVIQIHADAVNNPALKRRIIIINTSFEANMDATKEVTEEALSMLKLSI